MVIRLRFPASLLAFGLFAALSAACGWAQTPKLKLRLGFDEASGTTTASDTASGGVGAKVQLLDYSGMPVDRHGPAGSGVAGSQNGTRALDLATALGQGTNGAVAALTNTSLGFGEVTAFTATVWFKARSQQPANIGPRLFLLGAADAAADTGARNSIGLKFQTAGSLHFQVNQATAAADFVWSLPTNVWLFMAMVYDGERVLVYRGSENTPAELVMAKTVPRQKVDFGTNGALFIGNRRDRARAFDGWIDDFRFYTGAGDTDYVEGIRRSALGKPARPGQEQSEPVSGSAKAAEPHGQWVLVAAPAFASALAPLVEQRRADGFKVNVLETTNVLTREQIHAGDGAPLRDRLRELFGKSAGPKYLLLAGTGGGPGASVPDEMVMPALLGTTARMRGQPTDFGYALPDAAGRPTVAVGRFPARTVDELQAMVAKTLRLERARPNGSWRSSLLLVQGNPGGGGMAEMFLDAITRPRVERLHPAWQFSAISHSGSSLYYLPTAWLQSRTLEWLSAGQLFSIYLGHSDAGGWSTLNTNFMSATDWAKVNLGQGQGVFFSCGCFGCQWDRGPEQAYGLAAMRNPTGPAAVIGAYGESFSAPGLLAVDGLLRCCAEPPFPSRLADYWLAVQNGLAEGEIDATTFGLLDMADGTGGKVPLPVQRQEHLEMWTLLGDPALRLPLVPLSISMKATSAVSPSRRIEIQGRLPEKLAGAVVRVSLELPIGARPGDLQVLPKRESAGVAERDRVAAENHLKVNSRLISTASATAAGKRFTCSLEVPAKLVAPMIVVRAYAEAGDDCAQGALKIPSPAAAGP